MPMSGLALQDEIVAEGATAAVDGGGIDLKRRLKAVQKDFERLQAQLQAERRKNAWQRQFVSMVSHEFRTPLTVIDSTAQRVCRQHKEDASIKQKMDRVRSSIRRMIDLLDMVLDASKLEEGTIMVDRQTVDFGELLGDVVKDQREATPYASITLSRPSEPSFTKGDQRLLRNCLANLVSNAVKYSPENGEVTVELETRSQCHRVTVTDHGVGIPDDEIPHVFDNYFRASTSVGIPGTGLGLYLTRQLIEIHGGQIHLNSEVGKGSCFTVDLPKEVLNGTAADRVGVRKEHVQCRA